MKISGNRNSQKDDNKLDLKSWVIVIIGLIAIIAVSMKFGISIRKSKYIILLILVVGMLIAQKFSKE